MEILLQNFTYLPILMQGTDVIFAIRQIRLTIRNYY